MALPLRARRRLDPLAAGRLLPVARRAPWGCPCHAFRRCCCQGCSWRCCQGLTRPAALPFALPADRTASRLAARALVASTVRRCGHTRRHATRPERRRSGLDAGQGAAPALGKDAVVTADEPLSRRPAEFYDEALAPDGTLREDGGARARGARRAGPGRAAPRRSASRSPARRRLPLRRRRRASSASARCRACSAPREWERARGGPRPARARAERVRRRRLRPAPGGRGGRAPGARDRGLRRLRAAAAGPAPAGRPLDRRSPGWTSCATRRGELLVLEDNATTPSGFAYAVAARGALDAPARRPDDGAPRPLDGVRGHARARRCAPRRPAARRPVRRRAHRRREQQRCLRARVGGARRSASRSSSPATSSSAATALLHEGRAVDVLYRRTDADRVDTDVGALLAAAGPRGHARGRQRVRHRRRRRQARARLRRGR